jgi:hypothetical protein
MISDTNCHLETNNPTTKPMIMKPSKISITRWCTSEMKPSIYNFGITFNKTCFRVSSQVSSEWYKLRNKLINADFWNSQINLVRYLPIYVSCLGWLVCLIRIAQPADAISRGKLGGLACNYKIIYWRFYETQQNFNHLVMYFRKVTII